MAGITVDGLDNLIDNLDKMTLTEADKKKVMKNAIEPAYEEVMQNAPKRKGGIQKGIKSTVKVEDFAVIGQITLGTWYTQFTEYGTSQQKAHVGWFERSINKTMDDVISKLANGLLEKAR
ncbi:MULTISPECIES: HK97-gp10 family putative phage morphogenesis protein [Clostridium]|uniref:HK97-gp10 family putative phage morphogenesis protein n=1 Tax=Clostridium TaxID=1485 RepID=UPI0008260F5C|nr:MULTISPECIES: HK97-gp10 family putative phage morphogenesis protein [Clostridium]PJI09978.1 hypothetical protein CUB90_19820 [Clostridium sp. CT7]